MRRPKAANNLSVRYRDRNHSVFILHACVNVSSVGRHVRASSETAVGQALGKRDHDLIDPLADNIFNAVSTVSTEQGTIENAPKTEEDWDKIRVGAVTMAEASYLLKVRRPFAPAGDLNNSVGPDAAELSPDQITAKVDKDLVEWNARIEALRNVGLQVLDIVKKKDVAQLWDAAENLDTACESCHRSYWYPGETPEFYRKLDAGLPSAGKK